MDGFVGKTELLRRLSAGHARVEAVLAKVTPTQQDQPNSMGAWSIKDLLAHFIAHEQRALQELAYAVRGETPVSAPGDNDQFNAQAVKAQRALPYTEVRAEWERSFQQVVAAVEALDEGAFAPTSRVCQLLDDTIDGALANNTYEHYDEHIPDIEAWLKTGS